MSSVNTCQFNMNHELYFNWFVGCYSVETIYWYLVGGWGIASKNMPVLPAQMGTLRFWDQSTQISLHMYVVFPDSSLFT